ncbi:MULTISPECIES: acyl-[ACP]--phospholipid O-acyltransferase [unclassified Lentimonas]|uniref:acyl-[ACP]--phospholipid O-acyltransferase n=1 Tax=unclassified Lentimonas TaxID=2630993 RepID=UPI001322CE74|nr:MULTISPECIES: acyl-[ACP]--phospholipid O-acyltransferase [unclassified Lentimonas]CAA6691358.1 Putative 2-acylglycerophosphoethanolamine acyltransferase / acyl-acyl carrier protein synthetase (EC [Lentimonas sp. CC19]CAA6694909.1 Putative 2-acylglycerophosphoethanolamine acyltransferase / acyl-acyl carrier protein synthetase (EC [Lentimonas sp. CC10]CAA7071901.1 Putative 2-acylglycerophosphoethanolamine acyltransferase / acyl-acyl carrier protein synthetase (EC [Lentimonas sp. CC11]
MKNNTLPKTFWWHNLTQFGGAMNDNVFKLIMVYALMAWNLDAIKAGEASSATILALVGLTFALPFLIIVPIAGNFADRFSKQGMIVKLKISEFTIMAFGIAALYFESSPMLYTTMLLMSTQSAFFGPCKLGIIPEMVDSERLSKANGSIQLFTFIAIISGTVLAPQLSTWTHENFSLAACVCLLIAAFGLATSLKISPTPPHPERHLSLNGFGSVFKTFLEIRKDGFLTLAVLALAVFYLAAAFIQLNVIDYGAQHLGLTPEQATNLFLLTAIGIGVGSTTAGWLSGRSIEFGIVPIGALLMSLCLGVLGTLSEGNLWLSAISMFVLGFASGLFIVPLESFVQYRSPADRVGAIQAASSFATWIGILAASAFIYINSSILHATAQHGFFLLACMLLALALFSLWVLPDFFVKFILMLVTRFCYRFRVRGLDNLPANEPALLVCNHVSLMDAVLIVTSQQRRVRMLMSREYYDDAGWLTKKIVKLAKVILIHSHDNPKKLLKSLKTARTALDEGYLVCIFAEGHITRTGMMRPFKQGFERIVKGTDYPIIPVYIGGAWGSVASFQQGMPKIRLRSDFRYPVSVHFGTPLPATSTTFEVQQAVSELSVDSFELVKEDRKSLGHEFIQSARRNWSKLAMVDSTGRELKFGELLIASLILRDRLRANTTKEEQSIGILLPTGSASAMANIATTLDQRISVNLNYTAPPASVKSAQEQCEIRTVLTSRKFLEVLPELPLAENVLYMEDLLKDISSGEKFRTFLKARIRPARILLGTKRIRPDEVTTILFSSGSTAEPKGVMLSHHNLLSNIESFRSVVSPKREDVMLATLPFFHSFGYTVTFWFPLISGITTACHTNPLEGEKIGKLAEKYKASILLTTPSFLLAYTRKIKPEQFANLHYVFTGAEKLQPRIASMFEKKFGIHPLEGYGATELSPVCALSLPNVEVDNLEETGNREDRLGRALPGMAMKIVHPETGENLAPGEEGLIYIKGPNVMVGYLKKPELTQSVLHDGWYDTGDIGLMDPDGFFAITGRLSRFSKLGGEMISHGAVEKALQEALKLGPDALAVVAIDDERKGEKLCVFHNAAELNEDAIREMLKALDIPNLWKPNPKDWQLVDALPLLGTGKLDYRTMKEKAAQV